MIRKKTVGYTLLALVVVVSAAAAYLYFRKPASQPPANIRVAMTEERVARGKYLYALADCDGCHSPHDPSKLYLPVIEAKRGSGQHIPEEGLPGTVYAPNITPDPETGIGKWSDGEKIRAIREGICRDGNALFPMMPYELYRYMSDDDVQALVAYLNSLSPLNNRVPRSNINFPASMLIKGAPRPVTKPIPTPSRANVLVYGEYLVTVGVCEACHTPRSSSGPDMARRFAGGNRFNFAGYSVVSSNISPDSSTGIGTWTPGYFLGRFSRHRDTPAELLPASTKEQFTLMPWRNLSQMTDEDLLAMYTYLMSRPPVVNKIDVHPVDMARRQ